MYSVVWVSVFLSCIPAAIETVGRGHGGPIGVVSIRPPPAIEEGWAVGRG